MALACLITNFPRMTELPMMMMLMCSALSFQWTVNIPHSLRLPFFVHHLSAYMKGLHFMYLESKLKNRANVSF